MAHRDYCLNAFQYKRIPTLEVNVGKLTIGANNPIRIQSMTTSDTMDTLASIQECEALANAGCELIRLTAPSKKEAENLKTIKEGLAKKGIFTPLVADIHFTPNAAEIAAKIVEKVRINPGNYADKKNTKGIVYNDENYAQELLRIEEKFAPLIEICKANQTAMRIGTNHGSLSDRILEKYGDTPEGMVESALEFIHICEKYNYHNLVVSMKASNTLVMIHAYRLLVAYMLKNGKNYPLHLGVTEAGDGEDGRIKSAIGIGTLLIDGIGDTIRVSLTEDAIHEIPVAKKIIDFVLNNKQTDEKENTLKLNYNPFEKDKRITSQILTFGHDNVPQVIGDLSNVTEIKPAHLYGFGYHYSIDLDKYNLTDLAIDYCYIGKQTFNIPKPGGLKIICNYTNWNNQYKNQEGYYPLIETNEISLINENQIAFLKLNADFKEWEKINKDMILVFIPNNENSIYDIRTFRLNLANNNIKNPILIQWQSKTSEIEAFQIENAIVYGSQFVDGFGNGIWIKSDINYQTINSTSFGILQATRDRISKTEYISCPSCGRTLFDLQETTQKIRKETAHLKGLKIGIMGCIVNGPGEMADADYGYVGSGINKINLYKEKEMVEKNIPEDRAVEALKVLIKKHGDWIEPSI